MSKFVNVFAIAILSLSAGTAAIAQSESVVEEANEPPAEETADAEEQVDNGLRRFGYLAGLAHGCVTDAQRPLLQREALEIHAGISRLMGSDRAFMFSSAYGYGTNMKTDVKECPEVLRNYDERVAKHRAAGGGAK